MIDANSFPQPHCPFFSEKLFPENHKKYQLISVFTDLKFTVWSFSEVLELVRCENSYFQGSQIGVTASYQCFSTSRWRLNLSLVFLRVLRVRLAFLSSPALNTNWTNSTRFTEKFLEEGRSLGLYFNNSQKFMLITLWKKDIRFDPEC